MGFVNEKISMEDGIKYEVFDLKTKYYKKDNSEFNIKTDSSMHWNINREREIWFAQMVAYHLPDPRDGWTGEEICILHYKKQNIELDLKNINDEETSLKLTDNPFIIKWKLQKVNNMKEIKDISYEEIVEVLNEVLQVFGFDGFSDIPQENLQVTLEA